MSVRPWFVMTLIFILGIATGALLTIGLGPEWMKPPGAQEMKNRWMMHLVHHLQLTSDQQAKIQPILNDAEQRLQAAHKEDVGRISAIIDDADSKISVLLNPDQQVKLKKLEADRERAFSGHMHGRAITTTQIIQMDRPVAQRVEDCADVLTLRWITAVRPNRCPQRISGAFEYHDCETVVPRIDGYFEDSSGLSGSSSRSQKIASIPMI